MIKITTLVSIDKIDTGYIMTYRGKDSETLYSKAYHDATTRDERALMLNDLIRTLGWKDDFRVLEKRHD